MRPVSEEIAVRVTACPHCRAEAGAPCISDRGRTWNGGMHGMRTSAAQVWRRDHRAEYREMRAKLLQERDPEYGVAGGEC